MNKNCDNCYWENYKDMFCIYESDRPDENICDEHSFECECEGLAQYRYKEKFYFSDCLLKEFEIEECTTIHYYCDGEYLGSDEDLGGSYNEFRRRY